MKTLQYQLSNGNWMNCMRTLSGGETVDRTAEFLDSAARFMSSHPIRATLLGEYATVQERLDAGKTVSCGTDWYDEIRYEPAPRPAVAVDLVKCSCGHSVPRGSVVSASMGTSCPDCYDRMSE